MRPPHPIGFQAQARRIRLRILLIVTSQGPRTPFRRSADPRIGPMLPRPAAYEQKKRANPGLRYLLVCYRPLASQLLLILSVSSTEASHKRKRAALLPHTSTCCRTPSSIVEQPHALAHTTMGRSGGGNTKVMAANAKKAEAQAQKDASKGQRAGKKDAAAWAVGSNQRGASKAQAAADKQAEKMRRDAEKKALEAEEDACGVEVMKPKKRKKIRTT